jgi:hypothetical protein
MTLVGATVLILLLPFALHTYNFHTSLRRNQEKWNLQATTGYEMLVASNSLTDCTGGWNTILMQEGEILQASNSERDHCSPQAFNQLTVESLFNRIWNECIQIRPFNLSFPICNIVYDEQLGYPKRLDTYTFNEQGDHQPSITVERLTLIH